MSEQETAPATARDEELTAVGELGQISIPAVRFACPRCGGENILTASVATQAYRAGRQIASHCATDGCGAAVRVQRALIVAPNEGPNRVIRRARGNRS